MLLFTKREHSKLSTVTIKQKCFLEPTLKAQIKKKSLNLSLSLHSTYNRAAVSSQQCVGTRLSRCR